MLGPFGAPWCQVCHSNGGAGLHIHPEMSGRALCHAGELWVVDGRVACESLCMGLWKNQAMVVWRDSLFVATSMLHLTALELSESCVAFFSLSRAPSMVDLTDSDADALTDSGGSLLGFCKCFPVRLLCFLKTLVIWEDPYM